MSIPNFVVVGGNSQSGSYLLRLRLSEDLCLAFGRFKRGKEIKLSAGEYVYVGSALGRKGSVSLAQRLVRHATRTGQKPPHRIRDAMFNYFPKIGLGKGDLLPKNGKHLFWNVDHLLDCEAAEIAGVFIIRSERRLERQLGQLLEAELGVTIIEKGLGANDVHGNTHILRVESDEKWWDSLSDKLTSLISAYDP